MNVNDTPFVTSFQTHLTKHKEEKDLIWFSDVWKSRFCKRYNLKYNKGFYSKRDLYCQLVPSLEMTYALREIYGIKGGKGLIWNLDESMSYKVERKSRAWAY